MNQKIKIKLTKKDLRKLFETELKIRWSGKKDITSAVHDQQIFLAKLLAK